MTTFRNIRDGHESVGETYTTDIYKLYVFYDVLDANKQYIRSTDAEYINRFPRIIESDHDEKVVRFIYKNGRIKEFPNAVVWYE